MILLLDSTVLIDVLRAQKGRRAQLAELVTSGHTLATSALNMGEVYAGMRPEEEDKTRTFLSSLQCFPITEAIARRAGSFKRTFSDKGKTLSLADMLVASTALEHSATLMTDNRKDFPVDALKFHPAHP